MSEIKKNPIRIGIWGLGRAGINMHTRDIGRFPDEFVITAGCDIAEDHLAVFQKKCPGARVYKDGEEFLKDENVELVSIAVRSAQHVDYCLRALEAGKIVFLEKPIALSMKGLSKLEEALRNYPGKLYFRHNRRLEPCFNHIKKIVESGLLGEVYEIKLCRHGYEFREDWQTLQKCGGGQLNNWGPHIIDHALQLLGSPIESIWSDLKRVTCKGDAEDHLKVIFRGENRRIVDLEISGGVAISGPVYTVYGTRGSLESSNGNDITLKYLHKDVEVPVSGAHEENPPLAGGFEGSTPIKWVRETIMADPDYVSDHGLENYDIYHYLYEAIREGKSFPIAPEEAFNVVRATCIVKEQNPGFKGIEDEFGK